jgi:purine nucleosidase
MQRLVIDTDIGSDVDDVVALTAALGDPRVDLVGITTVYGDTRRRAGIAARICEFAGIAPAIVPGARETLSGKPVWWFGYEGDNYDRLDSPLVVDDDATEFLLDAASASPGELNILAIGPLTNIASAIQADAAFAANVNRVYIMGGWFGSSKAEHNFLCDVTATAAVFESGIECVLAPLDATGTVVLDGTDYAAIGGWGPIGRLIELDASTLLRYMSDTFGHHELYGDWRDRDWSNPHDAMALLPMLYPDRFEFRVGRVEIGTSGEALGRSSWVDDDAGNVRLLSHWDSSWVHDSIMELVRAGCARAATA